MIRPVVLALLVLAVVAVRPGVTAADAVFVTRAMKAATVAEVFIEPTEVRLEIEVGLSDFEAFENLLPDEIYVKIGRDPKPFAERLAVFVRDDWVVKADGQAIVGQLRALEVKRRVVRDDITGEPLPVQPEDAPPVLYAVLRWPLTSQPRELSIRPPVDPESGFGKAEIGFTTYHRGLAVMDFRYLSGEETVELDWADPWYSKFKNANLKRQYDSPLYVFLYVDAFEIRKEIVLRPQDLQSFVDLGLEGKDVLSVEDQPALKDAVATFLGREATATVDGEEVTLTLDRIHFVRRTLRKTGVVDPPEDLPLAGATLGVIFVHSLEAGWPKTVSTRWDLWNERIVKVPAVATDEAGGLPTILTQDDPTLVWENFLTNPRSTGLVEVPDLPPPATTTIPILTVLCAFTATYLMVRFFRSKESRGVLAGSMATVALGGMILLPYAHVEVPDPFAASQAVSDEDAGRVAQALLRNVYRAFDHRNEETIYDTLEKSVTGDLLQRVYLETRRSLELENQGGARVKVTDVEMKAAAATALDDAGGFSADCTWIVSGSVGHWGHIHQRTNQYKATLTIRPDEGVWKLVQVDLESEERL